MPADHIEARPGGVRRVVLIALATAVALVTQLSAAPQPVAADEADIGAELAGVLEEAETDVAAAVEHLQDVLADIPADFARGLGNLVGSLQAYDAEWFAVLGEWFVGLIVIALVALIGIPLCELLPFCTVF